MREPAPSSGLDQAVNALKGQIRDADNPVGAARAVRRVATHYPLEYDGQRQAFRWEAEKLLVPHFGYDQRVAKAVAWLACDAAWEGPGGHR